jgi:hypothetical protein
MRILRIRHGFQADHSSSSYLFYAVDGAVSAAGQRVAHRFSSSADVDEQFARYTKWGDYELSESAYKELLGQYYDVMASESYERWTLMIAVPKTREMEERLRPYHDLDDGEFVRLDVHDYGKRLAVEVFCEFDYEGPLFRWEEDELEDLAELLAEIRQEIMQGNVSFLEAVAQYYQVGFEDGEDGEAEATAPPAEWSRAELQAECRRRGVPFRKSWTKDQLRDALAAGVRAAVRPGRSGKPPKLSRAAKRIVDSLTYNG